jgi:hypothetical protein
MMRHPCRARTMSLGVALLSLLGCSSAALSRADLSHLIADRDIQVVHHPPSVSLAIVASEGAEATRSHPVTGPTVVSALGLLGLNQRISSGGSDRDKAQVLGERVLREDGIEDPVLRVTSHSVEVLAREAETDHVRPVATATPGAGLVLDFRTITWAVFFHNDDPSRYVVAYRARSRLLDLDRNTVLWEAECPVPRRVRGTRSGLDVKTLPTLDELLADGGAALKARFDQQADACAEDLMGLLTGKAASVP